MNDLVTLTFGEQAENHVGMEIVGDGLSERGYSVCELELLCDVYDGKMYDLGDGAKVLVIEGGVEKLLGEGSHLSLYEELRSCDWDKKAFMYGRVVNKKARWNLIFGEEGRAPDYENKKGRVVGFWDNLKRLYVEICEMMGEKELRVEGNYYYDLKRCGIGFHGDSERRKVVGVRLGGDEDLVFQWFYKGEEIGEKISIPLRGGDVYVMSEKATGTDWKLKNIKTLRHAVGEKYAVSKKRGVKRKL